MDPLTTYDVLKKMALAANGHTVSLRLLDGTVLDGPATLDMATMVLTVVDTSVSWLVPVAHITALSVS